VPEDSTAESVIRKVSRRLIPFLFLLYVFSYLDRINIGFAALSMNRDLGLTSTMFGDANTVFYLGYMFFEIPSNLMLARYGARIWIPRIMITWGIASTATMFASTPASLYLIRFLVGVAEAGFVPGVLLYLTYWFPQSHRARANAVFMIAMPVTIAFGASISGLILQWGDGLLGLAGWRWLFLVEGLPSVLLGVVAAVYLTSRPADAKWLTESEKTVLQASLAGGAVPSPSRTSAWKELLGRDVILLSLAYFGLTMTLNTNATWTPTIVREALEGRSLSFVGLVVAIPAFLTALVMPLWSARSDRKKERTLHIVLPMGLAAFGWLLVAASPEPWVRFAGLVGVSIGAFAAMAVFWTVPPAILSAAARPAGIAFISSCGIFASATSPLLVGRLRDLTGSFTASIFFVAAVLVAAAALVLAARGGHDASSARVS
jgi:ACS family 4-hydroxyphenylacetate permease-like MFS transporter